MNKAHVLTPHALLILSQTVETDMPSETTACPRLMSSADWTGDEVLTLDEMRDRYIQWVLNRCGGHRGMAARLLGIGRTSIYRYLKKTALKNEIATGRSDLRDFRRDH
jgi:DNA-binding NtrC family response regulator